MCLYYLIKDAKMKDCCLTTHIQGAYDKFPDFFE